MDTKLEEIEARVAASRAEFSGTEPDQSTRDLEALLALVKNWQTWADNVQPDCCCGNCGL